MSHSTKRSANNLNDQDCAPLRRRRTGRGHEKRLTLAIQLLGSAVALNLPIQCRFKPVFHQTTANPCDRGRADLQRPDDALVRLPPRLRMLVRQQQYPGVCDFAGRGFAYRYQFP